MSGAVFHPGHSELHGITVVLETSGERMFVGRYHEQTPAGVLLHDVAEHAGSPTGMEAVEFIDRTRKFGVRATQAHVVVPGAEVRRIVRLTDWEATA